MIAHLNHVQLHPRLWYKGSVGARIAILPLKNEFFR